mmetsp:Transcript_580/g.1707  ORF Transcript_580/g.1707 Transcript_580/m.1707 type:complete len:265 (+) Transcript_580:681-1475(+)
MNRKERRRVEQQKRRLKKREREKRSVKQEDVGAENARESRRLAKIAEIEAAVKSATEKIIREGPKSGLAHYKAVMDARAEVRAGAVMDAHAEVQAVRTAAMLKRESEAVVSTDEVLGARIAGLNKVARETETAQVGLVIESQAAARASSYAKMLEEGRLEEAAEAVLRMAEVAEVSALRFANAEAQAARFAEILSKGVEMDQVRRFSIIDDIVSRAKQMDPMVVEAVVAQIYKLKEVIKGEIKRRLAEWQAISIVTIWPMLRRR